MAARDATIHASALLVGAKALLIRGPSGSGKSHLAWRLLNHDFAPRIVRLIGDDRLHATVHHGRLLLSPADTLAGLIEIRGTGIVRVAYEATGVASLVVDLAAADAERMPETPLTAEVMGVTLPRLAIAPGADALPVILAYLKSCNGVAGKTP